MRTYIPLTNEGKTYIKKLINKSVTKDILKKSNINLTVEEYRDKVLFWLEKYCEQFKLNTNILAVQIEAESSYRPNAYSTYKGYINAMGVTQFLRGTINDYILLDKDKNFSDAEKKLITKDIDTLSNGTVSSSWRTQLYYNVSENPEIMIKAQAVYMNFIANKITSDLASVCLYCYNRGDSYARETYSETLAACIKNQGDNEKEGILYVDKIFKNLKKHFNVFLTQ